MSCRQPLHEAAKVAVRPRPQAHVKVVRHQAIRKNAHVLPLPCALDELQERLVLRVAMEDRLPFIAAVQDMIAGATEVSAGDPGHTGDFLG
jgi:hypothetical protein